jgi:hypothetical protein
LTRWTRSCNGSASQPNWWAEMEAGNGVYARLVRAELDIQKLDAEKAEKVDLTRVENTLKEIRDEVHELNLNWSKSREVQPWTRGQKIAAFGVSLTALLSLGSLVVTLIVAGGGA